LVQTVQKINSQPDIQVSMRNCITLQYFVKHATHGVKRLSN
jgi:hypothetical protein